MSLTGGGTSNWDKEQEALKTLEDLIAYPSINPPGQEAEIARYVAERTGALGATVSLQEIRPERFNVLARWTFGPGKNHLLFNTHLDVVPPGQGAWTHDPFEMSVVDGKAYGRGACDAKGSLASFLTAACILLRDHRSQLSGTLTLVAVAGEETGGIGTQHFMGNLSEKPGATMAVVGEPTGLDVVIAHKGISRRKVTVRGKAAHASDPALGDNAIYKGARLAIAIETLNSRLSQKSHSLLGSPCVSATVMRGGVKDNVIPDSCEISIDRRRIPGENRMILEEEIAEIARSLPGQGRLEYAIEDLGSDKEPVEVSPDEPIVRLALDAVRQVTGGNPAPAAFVGGTDMPFLVNVGGIPTVVLGPGYLAQAHTADEYVYVQQLSRAVDVYLGVILGALKKGE